MLVSSCWCFFSKIWYNIAFICTKSTYSCVQNTTGLFSGHGVKLSSLIKTAAQTRQCGRLLRGSFDKLQLAAAPWSINRKLYISIYSDHLPAFVASEVTYSRRSKYDLLITCSTAGEACLGLFRSLRRRVNLFKSLQWIAVTGNTLDGPSRWPIKGELHAPTRWRPISVSR